MANENFLQLPSVSNATLGDVIAAVQSNVTVQETLQQVFNLFSGSTIQNNPGNPNGSVASTVYNLCWDTVDNLLWVCTTSGNAATAVWKTFQGTPTNGQVLIGSTGAAPVLANITAGTNITISNTAGGIQISASGAGGFSWNHVTGTSLAMTSNNGYVVDNGSLVTLTLPTTSNLGDEIDIVGRGAGGWTIAQGTGQQIIFGKSSTTSGAGGSLSSTNRRDSLMMICTAANTEWTISTGPESAGLTVV